MICDWERRARAIHRLATRRVPPATRWRAKVGVLSETRSSLAAVGGRGTTRARDLVLSQTLSRMEAAAA